MVSAMDLKEGMMLKLDDGQIYKVMSVEIKGTGKFGKTIVSKLKNLAKGVQTEKHWRSDEKLEDVDVTTTNMEYLYKEGDNFIFMNPVNYEQVIVPGHVVGNVEPYLKPNTEVHVELYEGNAISIDFPKNVELKVDSCPPGIKEIDSTMKEATLENGIQIKVPQFIKEGDIVRVEVETNRYVDRIKEDKDKGKDKK